VNKSGLIDAVRKTTSLPKRDTEDVVNAIVHVVSTEVQAGRRVIVSGFGSFNPTHRGARMGRNPRTGEPVRVPSSRSVRFAPSGALKDILNGKATIAMPKSPRPASDAASGTARRTVGSSTRSTSRSSQVSTTTAAARPARSGSRKVVGRASARRTRHAPARAAAQTSARQAAGRIPVRTAMERPAKKAVRRA